MQRKPKRMFICFSGIDGSGKTTLATNLRASLRSRGVQTKYVWGAHNYVLLRPLMLILKKRSRHGQASSSQGAMEKQRYGFAKRMIRNPLIAEAYKIFIISEYMLQIIVKIRLPLIFGKNVVCDRYVYDTAINLSVHMHYSQKSFRILLDRLLNCCPKPDILFFVDLPEEVAYKRKNDIPSTNYLVKRRTFYRFLAKEYAVTRLDGSANLMHLRELMSNEVHTTFPRIDNSISSSGSLRE